MSYALSLSDVEVERYRAMAEQARTAEAELWQGAGIGAGASVADVGCRSCGSPGSSPTRRSASG